MTTEIHNTERCKQEQCMTAEASVNDFEKRDEKAGHQSGNACFSCEKRGVFARDPCCPAKGEKAC